MIFYLDNNILNIPKSSLSHLHDLEELKLAGNKIYFLEDGAFNVGTEPRYFCVSSLPLNHEKMLVYAYVIYKTMYFIGSSQPTETLS